MKWCGVVAVVVLVAAVVRAEGEIWEEDEREVLIRSERGTKNNKEPCRYEKGPWSECDPKNNMRTRTLTLKDRKKGDTTAAANCEPTKTIQKKCKKACRYEKGAWSSCSAQNEMVRTDTIKDKSDSSCEQTRQITKKCKSKGARPAKGTNKNTGARRNRQ
ncbi:uncharacterized protein LOC128995916 [Macrosteles quadrilineatus]|uniref:uncharacterized protein LOC128995268 n=1 Tax=Macrosteles quadrilineatus TaxID=74068 RepID=UPI0023E13057|nr:uncharacterized protein LOC128995268 [Macrosteles quadrilineatus]XP_054276939.1 uncharacterized protein LOC128995916 [Macrosteles quadrilineatus]